MSGEIRAASARRSRRGHGGGLSEFSSVYIYVVCEDCQANLVGMRQPPYCEPFCDGTASDALARPGTTGGPGEWIGSSSAQGVRQGMCCSYSRRVAAICRTAP